MSISERLNTLVTDRNLNQREIASLLGVSQPTVHNWLTNGKPFSAEYIVPLSKYLGVSPMYLLTGEEAAPASPSEEEFPITEEEKRLLTTVRQLDTDGRVLVTAKAIEELRRLREDQSSKAKEDQVTSA